jgi:hypothetical protein
LAADAAQLQPRLAKAEALARLEVELAAREAECRVKVGLGRRRRSIGSHCLLAELDCTKMAQQ